MTARVLFLAAALSLLGQREAGEIRMRVTDATGAPLQAAVELVNQAAQVRIRGTAGADGEYSARNLPYGFYKLRLEQSGFVTHSELIEARSPAPVERRITLGVLVVETTVVVADSATLLDPHRAGMVYHTGSEQLRTRRSSAPGRAVLEQVERQPGWVLEANGVLHPRGSEYDTQYVIDGVPLIDNRSPAFAPSLEIEEIQSVRVMTAGYPAEYGRKLGGIVEVVTRPQPDSGFHGKAGMQAGSFGTAAGYTGVQHAWKRWFAGGSANGLLTDRYLDPPTLENFSNHASGGGGSARLEGDLSESGRLRLYAHRLRTNFLVPNESVQEIAGQRQDRRSEETLGQAAYSHVFSPRVTGDFRFMSRDLNSRLWSNALSTPIGATQDRGFREYYGNAALSAQMGRHTLKTGFEISRTSLRERFGYRITEPELFDDELPHAFDFADSAKGLERAFYLQDVIRAGRLTLSAGLRWDSYRLLVRDSTWSPRLGAAWNWTEAGMVLRATYDRAFQVPATENLLLASSALTRSLTDESTGLPVPPSLGNFYEAGFSKRLFGRARLDGAWFRRTVRNYADDDPLLNTGVSFPISFDRADIRGFEARLEVPAGERVSALVSYSNLIGRGYLPITGGLFLEEDAEELLQSHTSFPITQDQRNTVHARVRYQITRKVWAAASAWYASGLPMESEDLEGIEIDDDDDDPIRRRVNFERGRVRPSHAIDLSAGIDLAVSERRRLLLQFDAMNLTDRLNVINYASVFSGTALYPPRSFSARLSVEF